MKKKWSIATLIVCALGYAWLTYTSSSKDGHALCFMQWLYHFPCPTCGLTRSVLELTTGNFITAMYHNPLGIFAAAALFIFPLWIFVDILTKKSTFENNLLFFFEKLRSVKFMIPFAFIFLLTWGWNIYKFLCI